MSSRLFLAAVVAVATVVAACGSTPQRVRKPGVEYLAKIEIEGNEYFKDDVLVRGLSLNRAQKGGRGIDEYQLSIDVTRIEGTYQKRGFLSVKVEPRVERNGDAATLIFKVTEGPRARTTVQITGLPPEVDAIEARALVKLADGDPFEYALYDAAKAPLLIMLEDAGYARARLDATVLANRVANHCILRYTVEAGPRAKFGEVTVVGVTGELAETIKSRAAIVAGEPYSTAAVTAAQSAIHGIGRFSTVRIEPDRQGESDTVPVKITVAEAKRWEARGGIGAGIDSLTYQGRLRGSLTHAGWPTPLTTLGIEARPALIALRDECASYAIWDCELQPRVRLIGTIHQQDLFWRGLNMDIEGGFDYLALEAYTMEGVRARVDFTVPLNARRLRATVGYQLAGYNFEDLHPAVAPMTADDPTLAARLGVDRFQSLGALTQGVSIDYRDDPVSPKLGAYAEVRFAEGLGGAFNYFQVTPDVRGYLPIGRAVLAARARLGVISGDVAPSERYYAGGESSQRGFAQRRLSPLATGSVPVEPPTDPPTTEPVSVVIGGAASFETSVELRTMFKPGGFKLGVVAFLDGGDVTNTPGELELGNLHWAVGFGIRPYYLPVGPIRIEVSYRLNRTGANEPSPGDRWNYLISVGEAF